MSIHDRPSFTAMMAPGRKSRVMREHINAEIARLDLRDADLERMLAESKSTPVILLAREHRNRVSERLSALLTVWRRPK